MQLLYGTYNPAKMAVMRRWLSSLANVTLLGLGEIGNAPTDAEETGVTPLENARQKAIWYRDRTGYTTLAADSALYIEGLADDEQPAVHARRMQGKGRMSDDEMVAYYGGIARRLGGRAVAQYRNGLCIAFADGRIYERFDESVASLPFYLVDVPHARRTEGFPLDSLSVDMASGQYYYDMQENRADDDLAQESGCCRFVREAMQWHATISEAEKAGLPEQR